MENGKNRLFHLTEIYHYSKIEFHIILRIHVIYACSMILCAKITFVLINKIIKKKEKIGGSGFHLFHFVYFILYFLWLKLHLKLELRCYL